MSKKITDDNGNTYIQKKPFYKRFWFWVLIIIIICTIGCSVNNKSNSSSNSSSKSNSSSNSSSNKSNSPLKNNSKSISKEDFDNLAVGNLEDNGQGGTSYNDVVAKFGKPTYNTSSTVQGQQIESDTWSNLAGDYSNMVLSFGGEGDNRALNSKSLTSNKNILSSKKITQADYDAITTDGNETYNSLVAKFGKPAQITVTSTMGLKESTVIWSNIGDGITSGVSLTLSDANTVIGKSQSGIK